MNTTIQAGWSRSLSFLVNKQKDASCTRGNKTDTQRPSCQRKQQSSSDFIILNNGKDQKKKYKFQKQNRNKKTCLSSFSHTVTEESPLTLANWISSVSHLVMLFKNKTKMVVVEGGGGGGKVQRDGFITCILQWAPPTRVWQQTIPKIRTRCRDDQMSNLFYPHRMQRWLNIKSGIIFCCFSFTNDQIQSISHSQSARFARNLTVQSVLIGGWGGGHLHYHGERKMLGFFGVCTVQEGQYPCRVPPRQSAHKSSSLEFLLQIYRYILVPLDEEKVRRQPWPNANDATWPERCVTPGTSGLQTTSGTSCFTFSHNGFPRLCTLPSTSQLSQKLSRPETLTVGKI